MNGLTAYALSKKYTEESLKGAGALKGEKGEDGLSIKALSITQDSTGKIIDATATLSDNTTLKVDVVTSEAPTEERLEGDGAEYYTLAPTALSFRSTAPLNELQDVQINGVTVDPSNYTLEEGSTIVTFPIDYLKTLDVGNYEVTVASDSKTVKGDFTVAAPELNEYGFYYNQPYTAYVDYFGYDVAAIVRNEGSVDLVVYGDASGEEKCTYIYNNNILTLNTSMGDLTFSITNGGFYCNELGTNFVLDNNSIVSDKDYVYINEGSGFIVHSVIDKNKESYGVIRDNINNLPVVAIESHAFKDCVGIKSIEIPDTVTIIYAQAFMGCSNLRSVIFGENSQLQTIAIEAFYDCTSLASVTIPNGVTNIGESSFSGCKNLVNITIPNSVTKIYPYAFSGCESLTSIVIPESVECIEYNILSDCKNLSSLTVPFIGQTKSRIDDLCYFFRYSDSGHDNNQYIPTSLKTVIVTGDKIGVASFEDCRSLTDIVFNENDSYKTIDGVLYAKFDDGSLGLSYYPAGRTHNSFTIPDSVTIIEGSAFSGCSSLTSIEIPDSVTSIGYCAFKECSSLTSIEIPSSVTSIEDLAFSYCSSLTSIELPHSVTRIKGDVFRNCSGIENITFNGTTAQWNEITKDAKWNEDVPATYVQCSDGQVAL